MIRQLSPSVYNKISAGEVVERPSSVVKELIENAIDAGAKRITVEVTGGGLEQITVSDDGSGIAKDDLPMVFLPHATSKISSAEDLFGISTMGFRGEAMASIAAVAMVELTSRPKDCDGYRIEVNGGEIGNVTPCSAAFGTSVTVRNLFYHTPARLKFLKSTKAETREITALIEKVMIASPSVSFRYSVDGKAMYETSGSGLEEVVHVLFDQDAVSHLIPVAGEEYGYKIEGFVSDTLYSRGTRSWQTTVVNGRVVSNVQLSASINNAYRDYLMKHNYPIFVLSITLPYEEVDVNVHPTKADVRFEYANKLFGFAYRLVKKALEQDLATGALFFDGVEQPNSSPIPSAHWELGDQPPIPVESIKPQEEDYLGFVTSKPTAFAVAEDNELARSVLDVPAVSERKEYSETKPVSKPALNHDEEIGDLLSLSGDTSAKQAFEPIKIVGQIMGTYIIAEHKGDMLIIDQHAAAERVLYDRLVEEYTTGQLVVQPLLLPYDFSLSTLESEMLDARLSVLASIGVEIVKVGEEEYQLTALPAMLTDMDVDEFVKRVLATDPDSNLEILKDRLAYAACHSALRGNTYLDEDGLKLIVDRLFGEKIPRQCPHGRPAYVKLSRVELDKMFRRIV